MQGGPEKTFITQKLFGIEHKTLGQTFIRNMNFSKK